MVRQYDNHLVRLSAYGRTAISLVGILVHTRDAASAYELSQYRVPLTTATSLPMSAARMMVRPLEPDQCGLLSRTTNCDEILAGLYLYAGSVATEAPVR